MAERALRLIHASSHAGIMPVAVARGDNGRSSDGEPRMQDQGRSCVVDGDLARVVPEVQPPRLTVPGHRLSDGGCMIEHLELLGSIETVHTKVDPIREVNALLPKIKIFQK